jgi:hypothetical protein
VHRVEDSNNQRLFGRCHNECEQDLFWRLEFASEISGGITPLKSSKGDRDQNRRIEIKFRRENTQSLGRIH